MPQISHEPRGYSCPFCRIQQGFFDERNAASDIVAVTDRAFARVAPKWWPGNAGSALVMPRAHVENLYELPSPDGHGLWDLVQKVAIGMRAAYDCEGISIRQHNEPAGDQDVWHLHVHVFPRYGDDRLYERHGESQWFDPAARRPFADRLRAALGLPHTFNTGPLTSSPALSPCLRSKDG